MTTQALQPESYASVWHECLIHWLRHVYRHSGSEKTVVTYKNNVERFFRQTGKDPDKVTSTDIENFLSIPVRMGKRKGQLISPSYRNTFINNLSSFYGFAATFVPTDSDSEQALYQKPNPTANVARAQPVLNYRALDEREIEAFFKAIPKTVLGKRDRALFLCYLFTSRRLSEIARLVWSDIQISVLTDKRGKMREGVTFRYRQKGRGMQWEVAELPRLCYDAIIDYLTAAGRMDTIQPSDPLWLMVGPEQGGGKPQLGQPITTRTIGHAMKKYCKKAGLDVNRISVHSWRHTCVQLRLKAGEDMFSIMAVTGHKSLDAFYRYARGLQASADEGAVAMEQRLPFLKVKK